VYARAWGSPIEEPAVGFRNITLPCPELKDIGDIKEIEEGETSNKLGKKEP